MYDDLVFMYPENLGLDMELNMSHAAQVTSFIFGSIYANLIDLLQVVSYLDDFLPEVQRCVINNKNMPARPDVQAVVMVAVSSFLSDRFENLVCSAQLDFTVIIVNCCTTIRSLQLSHRKAMLRLWTMCSP